MIVVFLVSPFFASADTLSDLQAKVQSLVTEIAALQAQIQTLQSSTITTPGTVPTTSAVYCPVLSSTVTLGSYGDDVSKLQTYLAGQGIYSDEVTGYFGEKTQAAVRTWQTRNNLVISGDSSSTGWGTFGPRSRAFLATLCNQKPVVVVPTPPTVCPAVAALYCASGSHAVTDTGSCTQRCVPDTTVCKIIDCAPGYHLVGAACSTNQQCVPDTVVVVTTGKPSINGVSGPATLSVGETGTWTVQTTIPSGADQNVKYSVIWGDESFSDRLNALAGAAQLVSSSGSFTHSYAALGVYNPLFTVSNGAGSTQASVSVRVAGAKPLPFPNCPVYMMQACPDGYTNGAGSTNSDGCFVPGPCVPVGGSSALTASPTSGAAPLSVLFNTYKSATSIDFGDGSSQQISPFLLVSCTTAAGGSDSCPLAFFNHTYERAGTYTAKLRSDGGIASGACYGVDCDVVGSATITVTGGGILSSALTAFPTSGTAPLTVIVKRASPASWCVQSEKGLVSVKPEDIGSTAIDFGDGSATVKFDDCESSKSYTYAKPGTYTIQTWGYGGFTYPGYVPTKETVATVTVSGFGIACPAVVYQMPLCATGQHVEQPSFNGCPGAPVCVNNTIYSQSSISGGPQLASVLTALEGMLGKFKGLLGN